MRDAGCVCEDFLFGKAIPGGGWDAGLFRFLVVASGFVLLGELGPGLGHFDQQSFVGLVRSFAGQAQAFGRAPLVVLEFSHASPPAAQQRGRSPFGSLQIANVDKWTLALAIDQNRRECLSLSGTG
jgi:hypothetical protein